MLGFSDMVKTPQRVLDLFQIIDRLNVHRHDAFRCLMYSDTLLVYNLFDPKTPYDRHYCVLFLAEFAQDLLYRIIGRNYYFRGILRRGPFFHKRFDNLDAFFGKSLIQAYRDEKSLIGCGLFIDQSILPDNWVFPTIRHCEQYHYVFLTQHIHKASEYGAYGYPFDGFALDSTGTTSLTYSQLLFLKDVYEKAANHPNPSVRSKFQATWSFYHNKYPALCDIWCSSNFNLSAIASADWNSAATGFKKELKSKYYKYDANKRLQGTRRKRRVP